MPAPLTSRWEQSAPAPVPAPFNFKGGIGSASRQVQLGDKTYTVGALVQTNYGGHLTILGVPVGKVLGIPDSYLFDGKYTPDGSCMIIVATDAPLSGIQLERLAKRSLFGLARTGSVMANSSGDSAIAFSTQAASHESIPHNDLTTFFQATVEATEESMYDALFTAETVTGRDGNTLHALPPEKVAEIIRKYRNEAV